MEVLAQNDPEARIAWSAIDRRRTTVNEASPLSAGTHIAHNSGMVTERRQRFATVLIGQGGLLQEGLKHIFDKTDFGVVASGSTVVDLVLSPLLKHQALLLIVDVGDDPQTAIRQMELFKEHHPDPRVAVLTRTDRMTDIVLLFQAGANACFSVRVTPRTFLKSLELVMLGETLLPSTLLASLPYREEAPVPAVGGCTVRLSAQEEGILRSLVEGHSNKAIANKLAIAVATVKVHVKTILRKIGAHNRTQAAVWALNNASFDYPADDSLPGPALMADEAASPVVLQVAGNGTSGDTVEEVTAANSALEAPKTVSGNVFVQQRHALLSARRVAEEQEHRDAVMANVARLRELRVARDEQRG